MTTLLKKVLLSFLTYRQAEALKTSLAFALYYTGLAHAVGFFRPRGASVLMYHSVARGGVFWDNVVPPARFAAQIAYISRTRRIVPLADIVHRLEAREEIPGDAVAITFDDGYADNLREAVPVLRRHAATATFFPTLCVVADGHTFFYDAIQSIVGQTSARELAVALPGGDARFPTRGARQKDDAVLRMVLDVRNRPAAERERFVSSLARACGARADAAAGTYLSPDDLRALVDAGMEIGSHTVSHPNLAALTGAEIRREIVDSKNGLERLSGARVDGFAYPFGKPMHCGAAARDAVRRAGYRYAVTTSFGRVTRRSDPLALPRIAVRDASLVRLKVNLLGVPL